MKTFNKVMLLGYVANIPELKVFNNNTQSVTVILKTREYVGKDKDGSDKVEKSHHTLTFWGTNATAALEILHKGDTVHVVGRLKYRKIEKKDLPSEFIFKTEIAVEEWTKIKDNDTFGDDSNDEE